MSILDTVKEKLSKLDNERLAIGAVSMLGLSLLIPLLIVTPGLLESEWFLNLLSVPAEYSSFIAGGAYIGRLLNLLTAQATEDGQKTKVATLLNTEALMSRRIGLQEKRFTPVGMLLGMGLAIAFIALHAAVPFLNVFSYFAYILFILGYVCALGGLFNRLGSSIDGTRLQQEKKAILFGTILGLLASLSLIVILATTGTLPFVAVAGISKAFFDLFVLHKVLFSLAFALSITSTTASFFDYFSKAYCFLKYQGLGVKDELLNERIEARKREYRGAFLGLVTGCLLTLAIITGLALTGGLAAAPIAVCATLFMITITSTSVIAALFSRIGRVIDGIMRPSNSATKTETTDMEKTNVIEKTKAENQADVNLNQNVLSPAEKVGQVSKLTRRHSVVVSVADAISSANLIFKPKLRSASIPNLATIRETISEATGINIQTTSLRS
ncbi:hypothetical protein [Rickettsiella endosymbiont of Dermanyssus gallinae]|uniref:hypothetical protein n=1 Tax=Rickettsiella endosymbiont of Dermanyssus gallinae TaxID=2856608 RepID=UPI001C533DDE|nr:hypothetical protein [Rickettsiella endosymbiont of Dermanyssus gallinae]